MTKRAGFTLIELLVVISIIAILSVIGLIVYSNFQKQARDSKRQSDLKFIQSALEEYYADNFDYPETLSKSSPLTSPDETKVYLNKVPNDPLTNQTYLYFQTGCGPNISHYCLRANMESSPPPASDPSCSISGDYDYCVTRP